MTEIEGGIRLQKLLARAGVASRRGSEQLMADGRVEVDGEIVTTMGARVHPETAVVRVDGKRLPPPGDHVHVVLHKPVGVVTTMSDPQGRPTVGDAVKDAGTGMFHVGRLDTDTSGLLLLTNHGDLGHRLAHPSYEVTKRYVALVDGEVLPETVRRVSAGIELDDGFVPVDRFRVKAQHGSQTLVELDLHVGRNRVVRRVLDAVGHPVLELTRTQFGPVKLGQLKPGQTRELRADELGALLDSVQL
ncbi:pseudouridine synthase [Solicola sp. PLA-1-18]|uniref:pseudouridine synthase n=1 Tax=Solicola sp. PLA-1-18 TaxID=3380532 RepID=UPI003B7F81EB